MTSSATIATAYHEGGHAVAAHAEGLKIRKLSIMRDATSAGRISHQSPLRGIRLDCDGSDRARLRAERAIIICLAGPAAQRRLSPRSWRGYHGQTDFEQAADLALRINGSSESTNAHLKWLEVRARELIEVRWREVETIAKALLREKELTQARVAEILHEPKRGAPFIRIVADEATLDDRAFV